MTNPILSLVDKDFAPGSSPTFVRKLDPAEVQELVDSLLDGVADDDTVDRVADNLVLWSLEQKWLLCHCLGDTLSKAPVLAPRVSVAENGRGNDSCTVIRLPNRPAHLSNCAFGPAHVQKARSLSADRGPRERATALGVLGAAKGVSDSGGGMRLVGYGPRSARVPGLARVLFTLLDAAGLHQRPSGAVGIVEEKKRLVATIARTNQPFFMLEKNQVPAAAWIRTSLKDLTTLSDALVDEATKRTWPKGSRPHGLIIDIIEKCIDETDVLVLAPYSGKRVRVRGRVRIPGEGTSGPYVAIMLVVVPPNGAKAEVVQAYMHPVYKSGTFLPVDSNLERKTMDVLMDLRKQGPDEPARMSIKKPLLDEPAPSIRPDFILTWNQRKIVVETMGYDTDEYLGRKAEVHKAMGQIGPVVEDGPGHADVKRLVVEAFGWTLPLPAVPSQTEQGEGTAV